jgi:hypothetical protein
VGGSLASDSNDGKGEELFGGGESLNCRRDCIAEIQSLSHAKLISTP